MNEKRIFAVAFTLLFFSFSSCQNNDVKEFKNSTTANEPTLKLNSKVSISKSQSPKRNDFIAYNFDNPGFEKEIRIHKLVAIEKDIIEILNGVVYVNKQNIDSGKNLIHFYKLPKSLYPEIKEKEKIGNEFYAFVTNGDSVTAHLEDFVAKKYGLANFKRIRTKGEADDYIKSIFGNNWNEDNFGPLTVPKNKVFVIGDNRHNSQDSRYIGFIDVSNIVGVVVGSQ